ncbi:pyruvate oxidase [Ammoniphilus oxalaticus]|uniref:Pyruvate oxidase n=2 Tax=Ammoniphilus oxalaticus TaxID=66863 RepID=A0A419SLB9_9BACL|nr:pyruvate oxidase [Ammoniphilus oxalaticus]
MWGVERIYGVIGDAIFGLMDAIARQDKIKFIAVKHESVASLMASAEAKLTGKLGVCISQMGPGLGNLLNGLGNASIDQTPVLAITGQAPLHKIGTDYKQYVDQQEAVKPFATFSSLVVHPDTCPSLLGKAMNIALSESAVTHLSIPEDVFSMPLSKPLFPPPLFPNQTLTNPNEETIAQVVNTMKTAKQPMILLGYGAKGAGNSIEALAEQWGAGIVTDWEGKGIVADSSPFLLGGIGTGGNPHAAYLFERADVVLSVGTTWWNENDTPRKVKIIQIANHQTKVLKSTPIEIGICGNLETILLSNLRDYQSNTGWMDRIRDVKKMWDRENENEGNVSGSPVPPPAIVRALEKTIESDAIVTLDLGNVTIWFTRNFRAQQQKVITSSRWRTMGFSLPAAMAAQLCYPTKRVVAVVGDGGLEMVLADLLTATRYQLPITIVLFNNGGLQMERDKMLMKGLIPEGTDLTNPDFAILAEACGWTAFKVDHSDQLVSVFQQAFATNAPCLIDICAAPVTHPDFKK